ncbi:MAG: hypothetical protein RL095_2756 [Verrucomicrobiota bacterium]
MSASSSAARSRRGNRFVRFLRLRLIYIRRHPAPPGRLALSVFLGILAAFSAPIGHPPLAILLAWICRCNKTIACLVTVIHIPPMYPVTWPLQYAIGAALVPGTPMWADIESKLLHRQAPMDFLRQLAELGLPFVTAFTLGGVIIGLVLGGLGGLLTFRSVNSYRQHREIKRQEKLRAQL